MKNKSQRIQRLTKEDSRARDEMVLIIRSLNRWNDNVIGRCFRMTTEQVYYIKKVKKIKDDFNN